MTSPTVERQVRFEAVKLALARKGYSRAADVFRDADLFAAYILGRHLETHTDETMFKVKEALVSSDLGNHTHLTDDAAIGLISAMQNAGILFRERAES